MQQVYGYFVKFETLIFAGDKLLRKQGLDVEFVFHLVGNFEVAIFIFMSYCGVFFHPVFLNIVTLNILLQLTPPILQVFQ